MNNYFNPFRPSSPIDEKRNNDMAEEKTDVRMSDIPASLNETSPNDDLHSQPEEIIPQSVPAVPHTDAVPPMAESTSPQPEELHPVSQSDETLSHAQDNGHKVETPVKEKVEPLVLPDYTGQFDTLKGSITELQDIVENLQYNVSLLVQNQASAADVAVMRRENEAFRNDSNMKLMRRYGIDAMIKTYQAICDKLFRINHPRENVVGLEGEKKAFEWVLKRMERQFKQLGIRLQKTEPGNEFNEMVMTVYGSEGEDVDEEETIFDTSLPELRDTVKESVCPAFIWTIPSLVGNAKEWCVESEKVCVFK